MTDQEAVAQCREKAEELTQAIKEAIDLGIIINVVTLELGSFTSAHPRELIRIEAKKETLL